MAHSAAIDIGITSAQREEIAAELSRLLADTYVLYGKTHGFHWNVTGPMFNTLHLMFMDQYTELWNSLDVIAERIRALGVLAPYGGSTLAGLASTKEVTEQPAALAASSLWRRPQAMNPPLTDPIIKHCGYVNRRRHRLDIVSSDFLNPLHVPTTVRKTFQSMTIEYDIRENAVNAILHLVRKPTHHAIDDNQRCDTKRDANHRSQCNVASLQVTPAENQLVHGQSFGKNKG